MKFKAKRLNTKEWVYGNIITVESGQAYIFNNHFIPAISMPSEWFIEVTPFTICRALEEVDKNGDPLFTGDIINDFGGGLWVKNENEAIEGQAFPAMICEGDNTRIGIIVEEEGTVKIKTKEMSYSYNISKASPFNEMEITGNIHD